MTKNLKTRILQSVLPALAVLLAAQSLSAEAVEFRQAIELALKHSGGMLAASADLTRARQRYRAEKYAYMPTITFGSGIGYSVGQPIAIAGQAPALFNVTHDQTVLNYATRETIKAAHSDNIAASIDYNDRAQQVILDTSLLYIELDNTIQRLDAAQQQKQAVDHALYIAQQRQQEGVGSVLDSKRAELDAARVDLRIAELETSADVLRERLGRAIGRAPATLETNSASIPSAPPLPAEADFASIALANSASVRVADEHIRAAQHRARAEHKMNYPSIDFAGQFAYLSNTLNSYSTFYKNFTAENYSFGLNFRIPILNLAQSARAAAADAEAIHAEADAQTVREQVAADAVRSQHTVSQLAAAARVSRLEYEVAQANIDAVHLQVQQGHANAHDEEIAQSDIADRRVTLLESRFEYLRAQLQLLRQIGDLRGWALGK
jgi:multidrug efflux system outer membrane protein